MSEIAIRLLDDVYMAWYRAEVECQNALRMWLEAGSHTNDRYCAYRAALDREEAAARDLERLSCLVTG